MMQTKRHSLIESCSNTAIGYVVAILSQLAIFPMFGIHLPLHDNLMIGAWFTGISVVRGYVLRRWFTRRTESSSASVQQGKDVGRNALSGYGCLDFCETHGRDEIALDNDGAEFCNECAADGWNGELCSPAPDSCSLSDPQSNERERQFMCPIHAAEHVAFCAESFPPNASFSRSDSESAASDSCTGGQ